MKFSHTLSLNANPDWESHYVDYATLKKKINELNAQAHEDGHPLENLREVFLAKLSKMVLHVREFFYKEHAKLEEEMARLQPILEKSASQQNLEGLAEGEESTPLLKASLGPSVLEDKRSEICDLFTRYHNLQMYGELNCTAVKKILKKYDKTMNDNLKETKLESFKEMLPFWDGAPTIEKSMGILKHYFSHFYCNDDDVEADRRLQLMVREMITYQRHTVWLDVVQDHRKSEAAQATTVPLSRPDDTVKAKWVPSFFRLTLSTQIGWVAFAIFLAILLTPGIFDGDPTKRNALALLVFVSILWAAETFALFVTSMLVPFLAVILRVIVIDGTRLDAKSASEHVFSAMFSHVIMLLLGGFSIAAALSKHNIARVMASSIGRQCGSGTRMVLLVNVFISTIASMWISNVAAPVLCYSLISPILKEATAQSSRSAFGTNQEKSAERDHRLCRALVMGIALGSNVGGMARFVAPCFVCFLGSIRDYSPSFTKNCFVAI